jgi:hypothetical protein
MGEISAASREQSEGISQIGEAVNQMDQATQQNAALVEESAAAAARPYLVDVCQRARQVGAQHVLRPRRIAHGDSVEDGAMVREDGLGLAGDRQVQAPQAVQVAALTAYQRPQVRHVGGFIHFAVEALVLGREFHVVRQGQHGGLARQHRFQPRHQRGAAGVGQAGQRVHHLELHRAAQEVRCAARAGSRRTTCVPSATARAHADGLRARDWKGKPVIAILNTWSDISPATCTSSSAWRM